MIDMKSSINKYNPTMKFGCLQNILYLSIYFIIIKKIF